VFDRLTPQVLEMALGRIGMFAGQFKDLDGDAKKALVRFVLTAAESGDANAYIKTRLALVERHDEELQRPPPVEGKARVTSPPGGVGGYGGGRP
jgi:hypothetical protein